MLNMTVHFYSLYLITLPYFALILQSQSKPCLIGTFSYLFIGLLKFCYCRCRILSSPHGGQYCEYEWGNHLHQLTQHGLRLHAPSRHHTACRFQSSKLKPPSSEMQTFLYVVANMHLWCVSIIFIMPYAFSISFRLHFELCFLLVL